MVIREGDLSVDGTSYRIAVESVSFDPNTSTIEVEVASGDRLGDTAFVDNATWTLWFEEEPVATLEGFSDRSGFIQTIGALEAEIKPESNTITLEVQVEPGAYDTDLSMVFDVELPVIESSIDVSCSREPDEVFERLETVTVMGTITNENPQPFDAEAVVVFGDAEHREDVRVFPDVERTVTAEFEALEPGTATPEVRLEGLSVN